MAEFRRHLVDERGLAASTVGNYHGVARRFLSACPSQAAVDGMGVGEPVASDVIEFMLANSWALGGRAGGSPRRAGYVGSAAVGDLAHGGFVHPMDKGDFSIRPQ